MEVWNGDWLPWATRLFLCSPFNAGIFICIYNRDINKSGPISFVNFFLRAIKVVFHEKAWSQWLCRCVILLKGRYNANFKPLYSYKICILVNFFIICIWILELWLKKMFKKSSWPWPVFFLFVWFFLIFLIVVIGGGGKSYRHWQIYSLCHPPQV